MPLVRFIRGCVWGGEGRGPGDEVEVTDKEALILCDHYKDAVRVDGKQMVVQAMTTRQEIETRDPVAEHRDPVAQPLKRGKK